MLTKQVGTVSVPVDLDGNGFNAGSHFPKDYSFDITRIDEATQLIGLYLDKSKTIRERNGSYSLKHLIEAKMKNGYLSNGELIVAMIARGFRFRRDGINCFFNVCPDSVKSLKQ